jgi:PKD repeat protein
VVNLTLALPVAEYNATFTINVQDPGADDLIFYWEFGDGMNLTINYPNYNNTYPVIIIENLTHIYSSAGLYTITLTVKDDDGGKTTIKVNINFY